MWDAQVESFAREFRVVRYDVAGYGRSPLRGGPFSHWRDLVVLLDELRIDRAALVGNSFGGRIALDVAIGAPERVSALVLAAPGQAGWAWSEEVRRFAEEEDAALESGDLDRAVELNLALWVDGLRRGAGAVDPAVRARVGEMQRLAFEIQLAAEKQEPTPGPEERPEGAPADVRAPTLLIVGDEDVPDMQAIAHHLAELIPGARMVVMHGVAHLPSLERPDQFNPIVREFLSAQLAP
jgi:pimeloyl-ACP methyl ester carboxylesterase